MLVHKDLSGELTVFRRPFIAVRESNNRPHPISNFCENFHEIALTLLMLAECSVIRSSLIFSAMDYWFNFTTRSLGASLVFIFTPVLMTQVLNNAS